MLKTKVFPEFSKLTLADREEYEALIAQYPPLMDLSFATLLIWWDSFDTLAVSELNGNLVISYWLPGVEKYTGLCLIGTNKVDESLCTLFDYLKGKGEQPRLINIPEFVISSMRFPELFKFSEQRAMSEYIFSIDKFYPLVNLAAHRRRKVKRFVANIGEKNIEVKSVDLSTSDNRRLLLDKASAWEKKGTINKLAKLESEAVQSAIVQAGSIGLENVCIFVNGELHGFCLYQLPHDERYVLLSHARINYSLPHTLDYATYAFAKWFAEMDIKYVNLDSDLGLPILRVLKLAMGPTNFFRKYAIGPAV